MAKFLCQCRPVPQNAVRIWNVGVQGAAELDNPKVLAAGSQLSLWFKAHMPDILTAAPQGHSLELLVLPCLSASDHAWHFLKWLIDVVKGFAAQMSCVSVWIPKVLTAHLTAVQASALLAHIGRGAEGSLSKGVTSLLYLKTF